MDFEEIVVYIIVGFLLWCLYASMYEYLNPKVPLLKSTVKL